MICPAERLGEIGSTSNLRIVLDVQVIVFECGDGRKTCKSKGKSGPTSFTSSSCISWRAERGKGSKIWSKEVCRVKGYCHYAESCPVKFHYNR
jgi:hypothetical protein